jgi:hypothetical protein
MIITQFNKPPLVSIKRIFIFLFCVGLIFATSGCSLFVNCTDDPNCTRVLFIGNSYTYVNDLLGTFASLAKSGGQRVETDVSAQGGMMLAQHVQSTETLDKLKSTQWKFVVLQEQSEVPAVMEVRNAQMYPPVRTLVSLIRENGIPNYEVMQKDIDDGYMSIVHELDALAAPVGVAWSEAIRQNPQAPLWQVDGSHPTFQGTYLAACVFYAVIFQQSPEGLSYQSKLTKAEAQWLQKIAADTVLNDKTQWNIR